jgi:hypothetical protein
MSSVSKRLNHLISGVKIINNRHIYDLILLKKTDIELLHSSIQKIKTMLDDTTINITVHEDVMTDALSLYLAENNFESTTPYSQDFGFDGGVRNYIRFRESPIW